MYTSVLLLVLICQLFWLGVNGHSNLNFEEEVEKLTNNCLDGKNHKQLPGPEDSLHDVVKFKYSVELLFKGLNKIAVCQQHLSIMYIF